jgi:hypothetical protein
MKMKHILIYFKIIFLHIKHIFLNRSGEIGAEGKGAVDINSNVLADKKAVKIKRNTIERDVVVNGTHIHVKSVFNGKIPLEKALSNIAVRKLSDKKKN